MNESEIAYLNHSAQDDMAEFGVQHASEFRAKDIAAEQEHLKARMQTRLEAIRAERLQA